MTEPTVTQLSSNGPIKTSGISMLASDATSLPILHPHTLTNSALFQAVILIGCLVVCSCLHLNLLRIIRPALSRTTPRKCAFIKTLSLRPCVKVFLRRALTFLSLNRARCTQLQVLRRMVNTLLTIHVHVISSLLKVLATLSTLPSSLSCSPRYVPPTLLSSKQ